MLGNRANNFTFQSMLKSGALIVFLSAVLAACISEQPVDVPAVVAESFEKLYPRIDEVKWRMEGVDYEAVFINEKAQTAAVFDKEGTLVGREIYISKQDLPKLVKEAFHRDFPSATIVHGTRVIDSFLQVKYEVITNEKEIVYSEAGVLLRVNKI